MIKLVYTFFLMVNEKKVIYFIYSISFLIFLALVWFIYFKNPATTSYNVSFLSPLNCILNFLSATFLCLGIFFIKKKQEKYHKISMAFALLFSAFFLISYLIYHHYHGDTPFIGQGIFRPVYFFTLISHILLTIVGLPFILITFYFALTHRYAKHRALAKWTFPIWLYISVTGVLIYLMLRLSGSV